MKKILYGIVIFDIIIGIFSFFTLLANSIVLACLSLVGSAISLVPLHLRRSLSVFSEYSA